jgi:hypothetical protein
VPCGTPSEIRVERARLKRQLASGSARIEELIAEPPAFARTAKVYELLLALPKVGPAKAARALTRCRIAPSKTLAGLTARQRRELIGLFHR